MAGGFVLSLTALNAWITSNTPPTVVEERDENQVRPLIWDGTLQLIGPHQPLGIPGDELAGPDTFNSIRPLVGYGPETMFNTFAFVYPPELAHVEVRGSSADRAHNETLDILVNTGLLGFLAFYFFMFQLFYYALSWLGWTPDKAAKWRLIILLLAGGFGGALVAILADGAGSPFTYVPLGLPLGVLGGVLIHLVWQGIVQTETKKQLPVTGHTLLLIGLVSAIIIHFVETHLNFSIVTTYTYFWVYAALIIALPRIKSPELVSTQLPIFSEEQDAAPISETDSLSNTTSPSLEPSPATSVSALAEETQPPLLENWLNWMVSQSLVMVVILMGLIFDIVSPRFELISQDSMVFGQIALTTWLVGLALTLTYLAIRQDDWSQGCGFLHAVLGAIIYIIVTLGCVVSYVLAHSFMFGRTIAVSTLEQVITAANVLVYGLLLFYFALPLVLLLLAVSLTWPSARGLKLTRSYFLWLLYPLLPVVMLAFVWFKNIDVIRADIYLKEGERYRSSRQWDQAIFLHEKMRSLDSDEDFYHLMLALDYQLMAQDGTLSSEDRANAWDMGEQIALEARRINPYNPDNTGNMGRYYFTVGQLHDPERYTDAMDYFEKAIILAPSNVIYHNLLAQTHYILQDYEVAVEKLQTSTAIDEKYPPTWNLLGDTYAAMSKANEALDAHIQGMSLLVREDGVDLFADQFLDRRLDFYVSAGRVDDFVAALEQVAQDRTVRAEDLEASDEARHRAQKSYAKIQCVIGRAYNLGEQQEAALPYLEECRALGDNSNRTIRELANTYLSMEAFDQALPLYQLLVQENPNDVEAHSALAYIYAQQDRLAEAIAENQVVLELLPEDYASWKNLAVLYQQQELWSEALTAAQKARSLAPQSDLDSWDQFIAGLENQLK
jgi:tetratricopeptide (TPR) repeat protein